MAKKTEKKEPIKGITKVPEDKLTVQKSNPLLSLSQSELSLAEFKILDTYLSRINSHKPEKRMVTFEKGELENILGVSRITNQELDKRLENLQKSTVKIIDPNVKKGFKRITLFEMSHAIQDDDGLWQVELMCTPSAMQYFFNIDELGYLRYKLRSITAISSRYTYIMFMYLESNRYRKSWEVDLDELRQILKCDDDDETLKQYKYFNRDVLKRIQKELHEKTECRFKYEPIKKGRKVVAVRFTLKTIKEIISFVDENQLSFDDLVANDAKEPFALYHEMLNIVGIELKDEQIAVLIDLSKPHIEYKPFGAVPYEIDVAEYIKLKCRLMKAQKKTVKNEFAWLKKACEEDW